MGDGGGSFFGRLRSYCSRLLARGSRQLHMETWDHDELRGGLVNGCGRDACVP